MEPKDITDLLFIHKATDGIYGFCDNACYLVNVHDREPQYVCDVDFPYSRQKTENYCIMEAGYVFYGKITNVNAIFLIDGDSIRKVIDVPESKSQYCLGKLSQKLLYVANEHDLKTISTPPEQYEIHDCNIVRFNGVFSIHNYKMERYYYNDGKLFQGNKTAMRIANL